jgi:hypothetical protein
MEDFIDRLKEQFGGVFGSQDSKYFIKTAFKITLVPLISFAVIFYSLWNVLELNYSFFVANGFSKGPEFKEAFFDTVLINISDYAVYFGIVITGIFMGGLFVSHLALRSFESIEDFTYDSIEDPDFEFETGKLNSKKVINKGAKLFFDYLSLIRNGKSTKNLKVPKSLLNMNRPKTDWVFIGQYLSVVTIICLVTNIVFYTFTNELYQEIVSSGLSLLNGNSIVAKFMQSQKDVIFNIYSAAMILNVILYVSISKSIIKSIDGVSYTFSRDIIQIVQGNHQKRIFPRFSDPGKNAAMAINEYLELVFDNETHEDHDIEEPKNVLEMSDHEPQFKPKQEDLPPHFIEEKQVVNGGVVFNVTTPKGYKVENLDEGHLLRLLKELELKE